MIGCSIQGLQLAFSSLGCLKLVFFTGEGMKGTGCNDTVTRTQQISRQEFSTEWCQTSPFKTEAFIRLPQQKGKSQAVVSPVPAPVSGYSYDAN